MLPSPVHACDGEAMPNALAVRLAVADPLEEHGVPTSASERTAPTAIQQIEMATTTTPIMSRG